MYAGIKKCRNNSSDSSKLIDLLDGAITIWKIAFFVLIQHLARKILAYVDTHAVNAKFKT